MEQMQKMLARKVQIEPIGKTPQYIAGFDIQECGDEMAVGVLVTFEISTHIIVDEIHVREKITSEYRSGFLALRELPLFLSCWAKITTKPDIIVFDGHGIMHPRGLGLASHAGVKINHPTFGVAKNQLIGEFDEPDTTAGSWTPVIYKEQTVGACLRTKDGTKPVFVSVGHKITLEEVIEYTMQFANYRIPEMTRRADNLARKFCREME